MTLEHLVWVAGFCVIMFAIIRWCVRYGERWDSSNSAQGYRPGIFSLWASRDTTRGAYARRWKELAWEADVRTKHLPPATASKEAEARELIQREGTDPFR